MTERGKAEALRRALRLFGILVLPTGLIWAAIGFAVAGLTIALARELHEHNIRVNAVAPATIRTAANAQQGNPDPATQYVEIEDVVRTVLFLAGDAANGVTGQIVAVTGRFDEARDHLMNLLELPGAGRLLGMILWFIRTPYRLARGFMNKAMTR